MQKWRFLIRDVDPQKKQKKRLEGTRGTLEEDSRRLEEDKLDNRTKRRKQLREMEKYSYELVLGTFFGWLAS